MAKLPSMQWYCGDWMKDPQVRSLSVGARGLWFDILNLMFECVRRGYLQTASGKSFSHEQLARMTGCSSEEISRLMQELDDSGVYSRTASGIIFCRRMVRDEEKRQRCVAAGKMGGNPSLKPGVKGEVNQDSNRNPTPSISSSSSDLNTHTPREDSSDFSDGTNVSDYVTDEYQFSMLWNACSAIQAKIGPAMDNDLRKAFRESWNSEHWKPVLIKALERLKNPLPTGRRFPLKMFLQQSTIRDLAAGTHGWLSIDTKPSRGSGKPPGRLAPTENYETLQFTESTAT